MDHNYEMRKRYLRSLEMLQNRKSITKLIDKNELIGTFKAMQPNSEHFILSDLTKINYCYKDVCIRTSDVSQITFPINNSN
ncbi:SMN complex, gem-associated protein 7 family-containing protein [Strongyloides ratti]|uniref:SMN complex, gem-associated protein 7 family-containing protein n=1 Tax=Strongyloides ratti TaxID=34506 RepID=A0A090L1E5_STRRB|nr:SMN complex, gem-associated protein 7 family-containing protein [Strongyloides ratti]CEF61279.1 SMN complex, gem-associated protein 7 family-containing protein [Strongyloides ratti]